MQRRQSPAHVQTKPEQRRQLRVDQVGIEVFGHVEERVLEDVRRVDPRAEPDVDAQLHHTPEPLPVLAKEFREGPAVAPSKPVDSVGRVAGRFVDLRSNLLYPRARRKPGPKNRK